MKMEDKIWYTKADRARYPIGTIWLHARISGVEYKYIYTTDDCAEGNTLEYVKGILKARGDLAA